MALISRNPFTREEIHREAIETNRTCAWCGNVRKSGKLFKYFIEKDSGRRFDIKGEFCGIDCMRSYNF